MPRNHSRRSTHSDPAPLKVSRLEAQLFELLDQAKVFNHGGVLVGTQAFLYYGDLLKTTWPPELTHSLGIDLGVSLNEPRKPIAEPIETFRTDCALNVWTSGPIHIGRGKRIISREVTVPNLRMRGHCQRGLDYLIENPRTTRIRMSARRSITVKVASPARFALHGLMQYQLGIHSATAELSLKRAAVLLNVLVRKARRALTLAWEATARTHARGAMRDSAELLANKLQEDLCELLPGFPVSARQRAFLRRQRRDAEHAGARL